MRPGLTQRSSESASSSLWSLMPYTPSLSPVRDSSEGSRNWGRYEELSLPVEWIDFHRSRPGPWIAPDEYFWTPTSFFTVLEGVSASLIEQVRERTGGCFFNLSLKEQCAFTGADYLHTDLPTVLDGHTGEAPTGKSNIELQVLGHFERQGWRGDPCEGATFRTAQALIAGWFIDHGLDFGPTDPLTHRPMNRTSLTPEEAMTLREGAESLKAEGLVQAALIARALRGRAPEGYRLLSSADRKAGVRQKPFLTLPQGSSTLTDEHIVEGWKALGVERTVQACERMMLGFGTGGWPDITMHRDGKTRIVEVKKGGDKFTPRQADFMRNVARPLGWKIEFLHVKTGKKAS